MTPSAEMFKELNWLPFDKRVKYQKCIMMYKALHNQTPTYITNRLNQVNNKNAKYSLRSVSNLSIKLDKPKTNIWKKSFTYSGSDLWNKLPLHIKTSKSLNAFKLNCFKHFIDNSL